MPSPISTLRVLLALAFVQVLIACGGSTAQTAGIEGSGVTVAYTGNVVSNGQITGIGSIFVNGVEYSLDQANIDANGQAGSPADLAIGQIVTVHGKFGDQPTLAAASQVSYQPDLIGPISAVDQAHRQITVLGQVVGIDADQVPTLIDASITPAAIDGLTVGREVEVSGFVDSRGNLTARLIKARATGSAYAVAGVVERIDTTRKSFAIRGLGVDYSGTDLGAITGGALANGAVVRIEGQQLTSAGTLVATRIAPQVATLSGSAGDTAMVEGWITRYVSDGDFDVNGHPVVGSSQTTISPPPGPNGDPFGISTLRLDRFVTVYGALRSDGRIDAMQVAIANNVHANILIGSCASDASCGKATQVVIDGAPAAGETLKPGDLVTSYNYWLPDYTRITPFKNVGIPGTLDFKRKNLVVEHTVRGPLESLDPDTGTMRILGQTVVAGLLDSYVFGKPGGTDNAYWHDQKALLTLAPGQLIEISGYETPHGEIVATGIDSGAGKDLRVIGTAAAVNAGAGRFSIQGLTIDMSHAFVDGFAGAALQDGDRVLASGDAVDSAGVLLARRVSLLGQNIRGARGTVLRFDGAITRFVSLADFDVAGLSVALTPTVTRIGGCGQPRVNAFISIYGVMDSNGQIRSNVEPDLWCYPAYGPRVQGRIESIDRQRGLVEVLGIRLAVFEQTLIDDLTGAGGSLALADLQVGDTISANGMIGLSDRSWTRVRILRTAETQEIVEGGVLSASGPDLDVAGVPVHTDAPTTYGDSCDYDRPAAEAFAYLATSLQAAGPAGTPPVVRAAGSWSAPALSAQHIQLQDMPIRPTDASCFDF